jgi:ABC-type branched-subunit amino acid transport system substrate-binding protein|tara:strand:- start:466 stop:1680 length:1215 start_codon:yes stop_codon:yes gene_type:complete
MENLKAVVIAIILIVVIVLLFMFKAEEVSPGITDTEEVTPGVTDTEVLIGNIQDLSGPMAYLGGELKHGAELYFRHVNESGGVYGRKIKMITEDHQYNPAMSLGAAKKLLDQDGVFCLFNVIGTAPATALFDLVQEREIPLIAPATNASTMSNPFKRYVFATDTPYDAQGRIMSNYIVGRGDTDIKFGAIYQDDDFGKDCLKGIREGAEAHGIEVVGEEPFQRGGAPEFGPQLTSLREAGATHIFLALVLETVHVLKTAEAMGYSPQFLGFAPASDPKVAQAAGTAAEGFITNIYMVPPSHPTHPSAVLYRELLAKYDPEHTPGFYNFYGFAGAQVLAEGLNLAGEDLSRERLVSGMEKMKDFKGSPHPSITYGSIDRAGGTETILLQVTNGAPSPITGFVGEG